MKYDLITKSFSVYHSVLFQRMNPMNMGHMVGNESNDKVSYVLFLIVDNGLIFLCISVSFPYY